MRNTPVLRRVSRVAALIVVIGATFTLTKQMLTSAHEETRPVEQATVVVEAATEEAGAATKTAAEAAGTADMAENSHLYHVTYKGGTHTYVRGDALLVQDNSYLINDNRSGAAETVAAIPVSSVESVVLVSSEQGVPTP